MSNALDKIKNKIRSSNGASVHAQLIDTNHIAEESKQAHKQAPIVDVYENVNVFERGGANESAEISMDVHIDPRKEEVQETAGAAAILPPKREKRKKFEELYRRDTFWIRNDLKDQLDAYCAGERGEKTKVINEALQQYFKKRK